MSRYALEEEEKRKLDLDGDRKELGGKRRTHRGIDLLDFSYALLSPMKCVYDLLAMWHHHDPCDSFKLE